MAIPRERSVPAVMWSPPSRATVTVSRCRQTTALRSECHRCSSHWYGSLVHTTRVAPVENHTSRRWASTQRDPVTCPCCQRTAPERRWSAERLDRRSGVCADCELHQGSTGPRLVKRDQDHVRLWRLQAGASEARRQHEVAELQQEADALRLQLDARPVKIVNQNLDQETVDQALTERESAYRARDGAFRALCQVRMIHREREPGKCRCGRRIDQCVEAKIVDEFRALKAWERRQVERLRNNERHELPYNHPAIIDPRWQPDGDYDDEWRSD